MAVLDEPRNPVSSSKTCGLCKKNKFQQIDDRDYFYCPVCDRDSKKKAG